MFAKENQNTRENLKLPIKYEKYFKWKIRLNFWFKVLFSV